MAEISCDFSLHGEWGDASSVEPDPGGCGSAGADGTCLRTAEQTNARRTGPLWVAIQQHLYRGWGPVIGGPIEVAALATTLALLIIRRGRRETGLLTLAAALAYCGMIVTFFVFNNPLNSAVNTWTPASYPSDWQSYRARWETGHALAALLSLFALGALLRAWVIERNREVADRR